MQTLIRRDYARLEKRQFHATDLGLRVNAMLVEHFPTLFDLKFTAQMEDRLDQIAEGRLNYKHTLQAFYHDQLMRALDAAHRRQRLGASDRPPDRRAARPTHRPPSPSAATAPPSAGASGDPAQPTTERTPRSRPRPVPAGEACPTCGQPLLERTGKFGPFLSCSGFPACRYTRSLNAPSPKAALDPSAPLCPACGHPMVVRKGPKGRFYGCSTFPACRKTRPYPA